MAGLKGKSTGNHRFSHEIWECPAFCPLKPTNCATFYPVPMLSPDQMGCLECRTPRSPGDRYSPGPMLNPWGDVVLLRIGNEMIKNG